MQMQIKYQSCVTVFSWHVFHNSFWSNFSGRALAKQMPSSFICRQENAAAVRSLRAKIVIISNSKWVKIMIFVLNYLTVLLV